jgi:hypothetical protein
VDNIATDGLRNVLREVAGSLNPSVGCQPYEISVQTVYRWNVLFNNHSGMNIVQLRNLALDNLRLRQTRADLSFDMPTVNIAISKILH